MTGLLYSNKCVFIRKTRAHAFSNCWNGRPWRCQSRNCLSIYEPRLLQSSCSLW